jgi:subfamily B ATP-binding cassette protein MsbA
VLFLVIYVFTRRIKKASREVRKKENELVSIVAEVFSSIRVVKAFAREDYEERRFERQSLENIEAAGARLVIADQLSAGALVVFLIYLGKMYKPMRELAI